MASVGIHQDCRPFTPAQALPFASLKSSSMQTVRRLQAPRGTSRLSFPTMCPGRRSSQAYTLGGTTRLTLRLPKPLESPGSKSADRPFLSSRLSSVLGAIKTLWLIQTTRILRESWWGRRNPSHSTRDSLDADNLTWNAHVGNRSPRAYGRRRVREGRTSRGDAHARRLTAVGDDLTGSWTPTASPATPANVRSPRRLGGKWYPSGQGRGC